MTKEDENISIRIYVEVDLVGGNWEETVDLNKAEWDALSEDEKDQVIRELASDISGYLYSYEVEND